MGKYLEKAATPAVLNHAWRLLRNERGVWTQGLCMKEMQSNLVRHIGELSLELQSGRYRPAPMRCFEIEKGDGGKRTICAATVRDKLAQRAVLTVLEPLGEAIFHAASFGFRPSCTPDMALSQVREWVRRGYAWIGDADIKGCFDHIPHQPVLRKLKHLCGDREVTVLVADWLESVPRKHRPCGAGRGLPQGMVLSPFLCNLHLHDLDCTLERKGIPFVRFADDFVLLATAEEDADRALRIAGRCLGGLGLEFNAEKTRVIRSSPRHRFLGKRLPDGRPRFVA